MISGIKELIDSSGTDNGVHVGLVSYKLRNIFDGTQIVADRDFESPTGFDH